MRPPSNVLGGLQHVTGASVNRALNVREWGSQFDVWNVQFNLSGEDRFGGFSIVRCGAQDAILEQRHRVLKSHNNGRKHLLLKEILGLDQLIGELGGLLWSVHGGDQYNEVIDSCFNLLVANVDLLAHLGSVLLLSCNKSVDRFDLGEEFDEACLADFVTVGVETEFYNIVGLGDNILQNLQLLEDALQVLINGERHPCESVETWLNGKSGSLNHWSNEWFHNVIWQ
mmetsp:Transcript_11539/g.43295  ORF Transcript_11539/g.43295 Transcript_11539/m.43295 type:complete len:227 (-) Transcript_11539:2636-3316(-)